MLRRAAALIALLACALSAHAANTCFVTEFGSQSPPTYPAALQTPLAEQTVAISGSSTQSAVFQPATTLVRITCDAGASIKFGGNPTATTSTALMPSGIVEYFVIPSGGVWKVAVIANS